MKRSELKELKAKYDVEVETGMFLEDILYLEGEEDPTHNAYVTESGKVYNTDWGQFEKTDRIDVKRTNEYCREKDLNDFKDWDFDLEIVTWWDGSNWKIDCVED